MRVDSATTRQLTIVKTYRQARILARAGVAVAAGPEPIRKDSVASRRVKLPGALVGYDPGHE